MERRRTERRREGQIGGEKTELIGAGQKEQKRKAGKGGWKNRKKE